jgi:hypothetical protein
MNFFAHFVVVAAKSGQAALGGVQAQPAKGKKKGPGCTPCAAQARKDAAVAFTRGNRSGG